MTVLTFQIDYHTTWGQQVCLSGSLPELGQFDESKSLVLSNDGDSWYAEIEVEDTENIQYYYLIRQGAGVIRREWGSKRKLYISPDKKQYIINDLWKDIPFHSYLYSSVFTKSIFCFALN
jgi:4-alpha-glucanotransferase